MTRCLVRVSKHSAHASKHFGHVSKHFPHASKHFAHTSKHVVHTSKHSVHASKHFVHASEHFVHASKHFVHASKHFVHASKHFVHASKHFAHTSKHVVHTSKHFAHASKHVVHASKHVVHASKHVVHASKHVVHASKHVVHASKHVVHASKHFAHASKHFAHASKHFVHASKHSAHASKTLVHVSKQRVHVVRGSCARRKRPPCQTARHLRRNDRREPVNAPGWLGDPPTPSQRVISTTTAASAIGIPQAGRDVTPAPALGAHPGAATGARHGKSMRKHNSWTPILIALSAANLAPGGAAQLRLGAAPIDSVWVNAPVAPEAIYIGFGRGAVSVIDLNGFGQGTGDPTRSHFNANPNIGRPGVLPPLAPSATRLAAGGAGFLTLTEDTGGRTDLLRGLLGSADDIHVGQPLDLAINNADRNVDASSVNQVNPATFTVMPGNTISVAPHPNPPRLHFIDPSHPDRGVFGEEPTTTTSGNLAGRVTTAAPPCVLSPDNRLLLDARYAGIFVGPQPSPSPSRPSQPFCPFTSRQQIGHFLYVIDRAQRRVHVVNSNLFTPILSVALPDPQSAAMAPNLRWLAVSNPSLGTVSFLDVDPRSATFHRVLGEVRVGRGAAGLAWQPEGEDLLVCNTLDDSVSIVSTATLQVRKVLRNGIRRPAEVAVSARQYRVGSDTWTYFALILNGDGTVAAYESGPTAYGADDSAPLPLSLPSAAVVHARHSALDAEFYVAHRDANGLGQVSLIGVTGNGLQRTWRVYQRYGGSNATTPVRDPLSGNAPIDLAFDETYNEGAAQDRPSPLGGLTYAPHSGKGQIKMSGGTPVPAHRARWMFVASADVGRVDAIDLATGQVLARLLAPGVSCLSHYWRQ